MRVAHRFRSVCHKLASETSSCLVSVCLCVYVSGCLGVCVSVCLWVCVPMCLGVCVSVGLCVHVLVHLDLDCDGITYAGLEPKTVLLDLDCGGFPDRASAEAGSP
jgi:hypothetical protein